MDATFSPRSWTTKSQGGSSWMPHFAEVRANKITRRVFMDATFRRGPGKAKITMSVFMDATFRRGPGQKNHKEGLHGCHISPRSWPKKSQRGSSWMPPFTRVAFHEDTPYIILYYIILYYSILYYIILYYIIY